MNLLLREKHFNLNIMKHALILLIVFLFSWGGGQAAQAMEIKKWLLLSGGQE